MFALVAACGSDADRPAAGDEPTVKVELPTAVSTSVPATVVAVATSNDPAISDTVAPIPTPEATEPVLINTPAPVANLAPDFTLPSIQGPDYTLSSFRGEKPVLVVFYRAYW